MKLTIIDEYADETDSMSALADAADVMYEALSEHAERLELHELLEVLGSPACDESDAIAAAMLEMIDMGVDIQDMERALSVGVILFQTLRVKRSTGEAAWAPEVEENQ